MQPWRLFAFLARPQNVFTTSGKAVIVEETAAIVIKAAAVDTLQAGIAGQLIAACAAMCALRPVAAV